MTRPIDRQRVNCVALPEAAALETWANPTIRARREIFAMESRSDGCSSVWQEALPGSQTMPVGADQERFFVPPHVGSKGWVGMRLDDGAGLE